MPGLATFPYGSIGTTEVLGQSDILGGGGPIRGYLVLHAMGGDLWCQWGGTVITGGSRRGMFVVTGGTGRFAGAKGEGTFE